MRKEFKEFVDAAAPTAYQLFWTTVYVAIGGVVTTTGIVLLVYLSSPNAVWLRPFFFFAAGFISACISIMALSKLLNFIKLRQLQRANNAKFVSQEKGFLDHLANRDEAQQKTTKTLVEISDEIGRIKSTTERATKRTTEAGMDMTKRRKLASDHAVKMNKHAAKLEAYVSKFEEETNLLIESNMGFIRWLEPDTKDNKDVLSIYQQVYSGLIGSVHSSLESMEAYQQSYIASKGTSQELNTVANRMITVIDRIIVVHKKTEEH